MDMRIANAYNAFSVINAKTTPGVKKAENDRKPESFKDTFFISAQAAAQAEEFRIAKKAVTDTPDVRADRVSLIKTKIETGGYAVSAREVAAKILAGLQE